jgi:dihydrofolate synthase/folylpolyglutamate synthase
MSAAMSPGEGLAWLDSHVNLESLNVPVGQTRRAAHPTLDRIRGLTELLGSPQLDQPVIHVTGTNGKTSVARLTTDLLVEHGLSVGTYTSPHLERVHERISWNGKEIDDDALDALLGLVAELEPHLEAAPSYFEILTAVALRYFADVAVDVAVIEVGLGGTWDATNVVDAQVAVVTNVSVDHVEYIGPTRADIATEKAGIVKTDSVLVLGETDAELRSLFADRNPAETLLRDRDFGITDNRLAHGGRLVSIFTPWGRATDVLLSLHGAHQADNAAVALTAAEAFLGRPFEHDLVATVFGRARSPGRLEVVGHQPLVLLDGAHNVAGAHALREALVEEFPASPRTLVVGFLREKDPVEMLTALGAADATRIVCARPPSPRALDPVEVARAAVELGIDPSRVEVADTVADAVSLAISGAGADEQVVVTGSLYVVGAARSVLHTAGASDRGEAAR